MSSDARAGSAIRSDRRMVVSEACASLLNPRGVVRASLRPQLQLRGRLL